MLRTESTCIQVNNFFKKNVLNILIKSVPLFLLDYRPKIGKARDQSDTLRRHTKGCNCKRSGCLKNYCECYEAKIVCSANCKCIGKCDFFGIVSFCLKHFMTKMMF